VAWPHRLVNLRHHDAPAKKQLSFTVDATTTPKMAKNYPAGWISEHEVAKRLEKKIIFHF
jgi:hypothetical protein